MKLTELIEYNRKAIADQRLYPSPCRGCSASIYWVKQQSGSFMPVNPDGVPHWSVCPMADKFRTWANAT